MEKKIIAGPVHGIPNTPYGRFMILHGEWNQHIYCTGEADTIEEVILRRDFICTAVNGYTALQEENKRLNDFHTWANQELKRLLDERDKLIELNTELLTASNFAYDEITRMSKQIPMQFNRATEQGEKYWQHYLNGMVQMEQAINKANNIQ